MGCLTLWVLVGAVFGQEPLEAPEFGSPPPLSDVNGQVPVATDAPLAPVGGGFLVILSDGDRSLQGKKVALGIGSDGGEALLVDDGQGIDIASDDGMFSGLGSVAVGGETALTLQADGQVVWQGTTTLEAGLSSPSLRLTWKAGAVDSLRYASDGGAAPPEQVTPGDPVAPTTAAPVSSGATASASATAPVPVPVPAQPKGRDWLPVILAAGLVFGVGGGAWFSSRASRPPGVRHLGGQSFSWPPGWNTEGNVQVVSVPGDADSYILVNALVHWFGNQGLVLQAGGEGASGNGPVFALESARPTVGELVAAGERLAELGTVAVVVQGTAALEAPDEDEAADAVLQELVAEAEHPTVLVLAGEEAVAGVEVRELTRSPAGLVHEGRPELIQTPSGSWTWAQGTAPGHTG